MEEEFLEQTVNLFSSLYRCRCDSGYRRSGSWCEYYFSFINSLEKRSAAWLRFDCVGRWVCNLLTVDFGAQDIIQILTAKSVMYTWVKANLETTLILMRQTSPDWLDPARSLSVLLDVGTDNKQLPDDQLYVVHLLYTYVKLWTKFASRTNESEGTQWVPLTSLRLCKNVADIIYYPHSLFHFAIRNVY